MNNSKVSIVIRNKNEGEALEKILCILESLYSSDIEEIILVDNESTDSSLKIAEKYKLKVVSIKNFSYGRAINYGISAAISNYILLLSSHAIPIGASFFKNSLAVMEKDPRIAGLRYINSFENYERALENSFEVKSPLSFGLMAACCMVRKSVWENYRFNEELLAIEDKEWSQRVYEGNYIIADLNETYFYFSNRTPEMKRRRYKIETISHHQLLGKKFPSPLRSFAFFIKKALILNPKHYFQTTWKDFKALGTNIEIFKYLKK